MRVRGCWGGSSGEGARGWMTMMILMEASTVFRMSWRCYFLCTERELGYADMSRHHLLPVRSWRAGSTGGLGQDPRGARAPGPGAGGRESQTESSEGEKGESAGVPRRGQPQKRWLTSRSLCGPLFLLPLILSSKEYMRGDKTSLKTAVTIQGTTNLQLCLPAPHRSPQAPSA